MSLAENLSQFETLVDIDRKLDMLYKAYQEKNRTLKVDVSKKISVR